MAKSIIQKRTDKLSRECFLCREKADRMGYFGELRHTGLHKHHFVFGCFGALRKKAEHFGLWGYVCEQEHHEHGPESPHENKEVRKHLSQVAQRAFEEKYGHEMWMQEFGVNYLEDEEDEPEEHNSICEQPEGFRFI